MSLNLNQRRAEENFKNSFYQNWESEMKSKYPNVSVSVEWETMFSQCPDADPEAVAEFWKELFFNPIKSALDQITSDTMGSEALAAKLTGIIVRSTTSSSNSSAAVFTGGVFTIDQHSYAYSETPEERASIWKGILESGL